MSSSTSHLSYTKNNPWQERAKCAGMAPEIFEYVEKQSPVAKGMSNGARLDMNIANAQLAEEICIECPVFFECGKAANDEDRRWTTRQGEMPGRLVSDIETRERNAGRDPKTGQRLDRTCDRGHLVLGGGRCKQCKADARKARRQAAKGV